MQFDPHKQSRVVAGGVQARAPEAVAGGRSPGNRRRDQGDVGVRCPHCRLHPSSDHIVKRPLILHHDLPAHLIKRRERFRHHFFDPSPEQFRAPGLYLNLSWGSGQEGNTTVALVVGPHDDLLRHQSSLGH